MVTKPKTKINIPIYCSVQRNQKKNISEYQNIPANRETTYLKILLKNKKVFKYQIPRINIERQKLKKL